MSEEQEGFFRWKNPTMWGAFASILVIGGGFLIWYFGTSCNQVSEHFTQCNWKSTQLMNASPNEIGDALAGFAGTLALVWIVVTVAIQSRELSEQRKQLRQQTEEFKATNAVLEAQRFDSFFFELVATHNAIVAAIDIRTIDQTKLIGQGRDCFRYFFRQISEKSAGEAMYPNLTTDNTLEKYEALYKKHRSDLGHYFRFLFNSMRVIETSPSAQDKHKKLFRSLFSDDELLVIFYNAVSPRGENLKPLIESFEFFNNLPQDRLIYRTHKSLLSPKSFGETP